MEKAEKGDDDVSGFYTSCIVQWHSFSTGARVSSHIRTCVLFLAADTSWELPTIPAALVNGEG